jgi:hypothetical protein
MKILKINSSEYDYGACAFNGATLTVIDVVNEMSNETEMTFDTQEFSAEIIEFDAELSDNDIKILNSLANTHFDEFHKIK